MFLRATVIWLAILVLAVANGAVRDKVVSPRIGDTAGRAVSTVVLAGLILLVSWLAVRWIGPTSASDAWRVGLLWMCLTLAFEFLAGHYLFGNSWEKVLSDYNLLRGRIWALIPLVTLVAPAWAYRS